jgi:hypothetical protein
MTWPPPCSLLMSSAVPCIAHPSCGLGVTKRKTGCVVDSATASNPPATPLDAGDLTLNVSGTLDVMRVDKPFGRHDLTPSRSSLRGVSLREGPVGSRRKLATTGLNTSAAMNLLFEACSPSGPIAIAKRGGPAGSRILFVPSAPRLTYEVALQLTLPKRPEDHKADRGESWGNGSIKSQLASAKGVACLSKVWGV